MAARDMLDRALQISEADWQQQLLKLAHDLGWKHMHVRRSIGKGRRWTTATNVAGWPDLTLYRPAKDATGELIFVEVKSETGTVEDDQVVVHEELRRAGQEVFVWRPSDLDAAFDFDGHTITVTMDRSVFDGFAAARAKPSDDALERAYNNGYGDGYEEGHGDGESVGYRRALADVKELAEPEATAS